MFKSINAVVSAGLILFSAQSAVSAPVTVFPPTKYTATLSGATFNKTFNHSLNNAQGVLTVVNGDGSDLSQKDCRNLNLVKTIICKAENIARALAVVLLRPSSIEVTLNGQVVATSAQLPPEAGKFQKPVVLKLSNALKVKIKGSPLAFITIDVKAESQTVNQNPIANFTATPATGIAPILISFSGLTSTDPDGTIVSYAWEFGDGGVSTDAVATHLYNTPGNYIVKLTVRDNQGASNTKSQTIVVTQDTIAPLITISSPLPGSTIANSAVSIAGQSNERLSTVTAQLNGEAEQSLVLSADKMSILGSINTIINGSRTLTIRARDLAGNLKVATVLFNYVNNEPPVARLALKTSSQGIAPYIVLFDASLSSDPLNLPISYNWNFGDGVSSTTTSGFATHLYENAGSYVARLTVTNSAGLSDSEEIEIRVNQLQLPSAPETIAPALVENNIAKPFKDSVSFIYEGPNALQKGIQAGSIDPKRVSIIKGKILDEGQQPVSGVKVTIVKGSVLGHTYTRENGEYDIAVNGGASTTVQYEKPGYLPAQRAVTLNYNDFSTAETAVLVKVDPVVTVIRNEAPEIQIVKGSQLQDSDGQRTATLLIPSSTKASIELPNGQLTELSSLSLRITEYTVGENGPERMPASLPKSSSYTYAVDITSDEALALNAKHIKFSKPVSFYVDNFLNFPVGSVIPVGSYDYDKGAWLPEANGRVVRILSIQSGAAVLDVMGNGSAATQAELDGLLINVEELQKIAQVYSAGKVFWRSTASRFSPFDLNVLAGTNGLPPDNAIGANDFNAPDNCPCRGGSIIEVINQNLREFLPIIGTDFSLGYSSNSALDLPDALEVQLTNSNSIPADLQQVDLQIEVAGRTFKRSFPAALGLKYTYLWNGFDVYNRKVDGRVKAKVKITYHYPSTYLTPLLQFPSEFAMYPVKLTDSGIPGREWASLSTDYNTFMGKPSMARRNIGEWSLPIYHSYNVEEKYLTMGNGTLVGGIDPKFSKLRPLEVIMGDGTRGYSPDGTIARQAKLYAPHPIMYASDRSIYFSDAYPLIRRIKPDGRIETVAGTGSSGYSGDGGPATGATFRTGLNSIKLVEGEEKEFYIADIGNCVIRKIDKNGIINTIAGTGVCGYSGSDGPARQAQLGTIFQLAFNQGSIFIAESDKFTIREITAGGLIRVVVGDGFQGYTPDGYPATEGSINAPGGLAFTAEGELVFAESNSHLIRKVNKMGNLVTLVGNRIGGNSPDGTAANIASITYPYDIKVLADNSIYYRDGIREQIRYVSANGTLQTLAGVGGHGITESGEIALKSKLGGIRQFDFSPEGDVYIVEQDNNRIVKVTNPLNIKQDTNGFYPIPSEDGSEIYLFDYQGIHVRTLFGKTASTKYQFVHNSNNQLIEIIDGNNNVTTFARDSDGLVTDITGPYGQRSGLVYTNGKLSNFTMPNNTGFTMSYGAMGQLTSFTKPNSSTSTFQYDATGRLTKDTNSAGGFTSLQRIVGENVESVRVTTAEGAQSFAQHVRYQNGSQMVDRESSGRNLATLSYADGNRTLYTFDNYSEAKYSAKDQRLGLPVSFYADIIRKSDNLERREIKQKVYTRLVDSSDYDLVETNYVNSVFKNRISYTSANKTFAMQSGENRLSSVQIDSKERIVRSSVGTLTPVDYSRDTRGQLTSITQGGRSTNFVIGSNGKVASAIDSMGRQTSYFYDENLRVVKQILPGNREVGYQYDNNDNIVAIFPPNRPLHQLNFNLVDLLSSYAPPSAGAGQSTTSFTYNLDKKLTGVARPDGKNISYDYDQITGLLTSIQTQAGNYNHTYNRHGQLTGISSPYGVNSINTYLNEFLATQHSYLGSQYLGGVNLFYDMDHRLSFLLINTSDSSQAQSILYDRDDNIIRFGALNLSYNSNSLLSSTTVGLVQEIFGYNNFGEVISSTANFNSSPIHSMILTRDEIGRIVSKDEGPDSFAYKYDDSGRLEEVKKNGIQVGLYSYDMNGNRVSSVVRGVTSSAIYDNQDKLLSYANKTFSYNNNGDLVSIVDSITNVTKSFAYDEFGNLTQAIVPGKNIQFLADGFNRRILKRVNGAFVQSLTYLNQTQIVAENDLSGMPISKFIYATKGNSPDLMIRDGVTYKIIKDHIGSVRKVISENSGSVVQEIIYDEFGVVLMDTNPGFQPFGFAGGLYDRDLNLVRFGARDYDAEIGRWTTKDPIFFQGGDSNLFGYALMDPINYFDSDGKNAQIIIGGIAYGFAQLALLGSELGGLYALMCLDYPQLSMCPQKKVPPPPIRNCDPSVQCCGPGK